MRIKLVTEQSDHDLPCIDIYYSDSKEAFDMGQVFETITEASLTAWRINGGIRIPLVIMNKIGLVDKEWFLRQERDEALAKEEEKI